MICVGSIDLSIVNSIDVLLQETESEMEDTDEIVYIHPNQSHIDISQLIYEAIILSIPSKIEHSGVEMTFDDKEMMVLLDKYANKKETNDPRWDDLNKLKDLI